MILLVPKCGRARMLYIHLHHSTDQHSPLSALVPLQFGPRNVICNPYIIFVMGTLAMYAVVFITIGLRSFWLDRTNHKPWRIYRWALALLFVAYMVIFLVVFVMFVRGKCLVNEIVSRSWTCHGRLGLRVCLAAAQMHTAVVFCRKAI